MSASLSSGTEADPVGAYALSNPSALGTLEMEIARRALGRRRSRSLAPVAVQRRGRTVSARPLFDNPYRDSTLGCVLA